MIDKQEELHHNYRKKTSYLERRCGGMAKSRAKASAKSREGEDAHVLRKLRHEASGRGGILPGLWDKDGERYAG